MGSVSGMERLDIVIAGGGAAGLSLAIALRLTLPGAPRIAVLAAPGPENNRSREWSNRASLIAAGPCRMFRAFGIWGALESAAQPIRSMEITDSRVEDAIRPVLLRFGNSLPDNEPTGHMIAHGVLEPALEQRAQELGIDIRQCRVSGLHYGPASAIVEELAGGKIRASLVVGADGRQSTIRKLAGIGVVQRDYRRAGIVATLSLERDHHGIAVQHFLPAGTLALLPMTSRRMSIVWVETQDEARKLCAAPAEEFVLRLQALAGHRWGRLGLLDAPQTFPLSLAISRAFSGERIVLVGDAAHGVHPLAGQGLNLGLRDVAVLADVLREAVINGLDFGDPAVLRDYEMGCRPAAVAMAGATDGLFDLFTNALPPVRILRDAGMKAFGASKTLTDNSLLYAAGLQTPTPRLFAAANTAIP